MATSPHVTASMPRSRSGCTRILIIFYSYTPRSSMNTMKEFDLQFKILTIVDTTKSYVILNESINKLYVLVNLSF